MSAIVEERVAIITDSCTDVPQESIERSGIRVIPLHINYKDATYRDRVDIQPDQVYARFEQEIPKTSTPTPAEVTAAFNEAAAEGYTHVIAVTISSGLSGTYNLMRSVAAGAVGLTCEVIDTLNIGLGAGLVVMAAARFLDEGLPFAEAVKRTRAIVDKTKVFFCVNTLDYLYAGGRIGKATYELGSRLDIRPVITCDAEGKYVTAAKSHGRKGSLKKAMQLAKKYAGDATRLCAVVVHGGAEDEAREVLAKLQAEMPHVEEWSFGQISPALVVHTGPGLIGIGVQIMD